MLGDFQDIIVVPPFWKTSPGYGLISRVAGHWITDSNTPHSIHVVSRQSGETAR
jgi:hypothetical protein